MDKLTELNGVAYGLDESVYFKAPGLSKSTLSAIAGLGDMDFDSSALRVGSLVDCLVFTPDEFYNRYLITSADRRGTKEWKAAEEEANGREVIKQQDFDDALLMTNSLLEHDEAIHYLNGKHQVSVFWTDELSGIKCKARPDCVGEHLSDLKTSVSVSAWSFAKQAAELKYHWQDVWYSEGLAANGMEFERMYFVVVQKKPVRLYGQSAKRHPIGIFTFDDAAREQAAREIAEWRSIYKLCQANNDWPEFEKKPQVISLPKYYTGE